MIEVGRSRSGRERRGGRERSRAQWLSRGIDADRERLARELHDETGQILALAQLKLDGYLGRLRPEDVGLASELREVRESLSAATRDLRNLIYQSSPPMLAEWGLGRTIQWLVQQFAARNGVIATYDGIDTLCNGIDPMCDGTNADRLPVVLEMALLRIIQEALTNVAKHSRAQTVEVRLTIGPEWVTATIADDGQGFDLAQVHVSTNPTFGLRGMRERARELGGEMTVATAPGRGTIVQVTLNRLTSGDETNGRAIRQRSPDPLSGGTSRPRRARGLG